MAGDKNTKESLALANLPCALTLATGGRCEPFLRPNRRMFDKSFDDETLYLY